MSSTILYTLAGGSLLVLFIFVMIVWMKKRSAANLHRELSTEIESHLSFTIPEKPPVEEEKPVQGELDVLIKNKKVSTTRIFSNQLKIGRDPSVAELVIAEPTVSKLHCTLHIRPDGIVVRDNHSTNGTFVDEQRIEEKTVPDDTTISLGRRGTVKLVIHRSKP